MTGLMLLASCGDDGPASRSDASTADTTGSDATPDDRHYVFVTSVMGTGNLGSWADAGGATGLAAADNVCNARAIAAGLSGTFVAWLSTATDDAYCRVQGFSGENSANCGQAMLPRQAGPWSRRDGSPFGLSLLATVGSQQYIYNPTRFDENGTALPGHLYFTNSEGPGQGDSGDCGGWTNETGLNVDAGQTDATALQWSYGGATPDCSESHHLLCFERGVGPALTFPAISGKRVFVTSATGNCNLSTWTGAGGQTGLAAADAICKARATAASLTDADRFEAMLATSTSAITDRISSDGPFVRIDGVRVAANKQALVTSTLDSTIHQAENGMYPDGFVWTGAGGTDTCGDWTGGNGGVAMVGRNFLATAQWATVPQNHATYSTIANRLYCVED